MDGEPRTRKRPSRRHARPPSRDRLLAAAREEFARRGFDGATVDRIAARARLNKAMLYYHFHSKADLYREILRALFRGVADAVTAVQAAGGAPEVRLRGFAAAVAHHGVDQPHFPAIWLREMADGGRHLDGSIIAEIARVLATLSAILADGRRAGRFRAANPFLTHMGIVAPLMFFAASAPVRRRFGRASRQNVEPPPEALLAYVQQSALAALAPAGHGAAPPEELR